MDTASNTINIGMGFSRIKDTAKAVKESAAQALSGIGQRKIDLAVIFTSIEHAYYTTIKSLARCLGPMPTIGCSAAAIISDEGVSKTGVAILLLSFPKTIYLNTAFVKDIRAKGAFYAGKELGEKLLCEFSGVRRDMAIIFSDGLLEDNSSFIHGLQEKLGASFPLIGASASDNLQFNRTFVYSNQDVTGDAVSGIIWGGKLHFGWGIKHGWKPIGKPRYVTKAAANVVYEIDRLPAVNIYEEYLARNLSELKKELKRVSIFYPIGIYTRGEKEYLLRNVRSIGEDGSLIFQGDVPENSLIRLMIGTKESCLNATRQAADEIKRDFSAKRFDFAFVFDSVSRYILLGRDAHKELEIIKKTLGNIPIFGIYTYGETAPLRAINYQGKTYFHNQTIAILGVAG